MRFRPTGRDVLEVRPPGKPIGFFGGGKEDWDELVAYRYGHAWLHVEQMNDRDYFLALYDKATGRRVVFNVRVGTTARPAVEVTLIEDELGVVREADKIEKKGRRK